VAAASWHAVLLTESTNDNFLHLTLAKQLLAGEWPVRDFFDHGWVLQYGLSALAEILFGERLLSEAIIVGAAWGVSTYLVFCLVRRLTDSTAAAVLSAVLLIMAGPRGYAYPKGIAYAGAAVLWWRYQRKPTVRTAVWFGAWAAVAFYWRPDHGIFVAVGFVFAALAAHGVRTVTLARCSIAGVTAAALVAPFLVYVQLTSGLAHYVEAGYVLAKTEHTTHAPHRFPLIRYARDLVRIVPADSYAPVVMLRWSASSSPAVRQAVMTRYELTHVSTEDARLDRVRMSVRSLAAARELLNEPAVEDTSGIDRTTATIPPDRWTTWQRRMFEHAWLRIRVLPSLDSHARASEILVAVLYVLPLVVLITVRTRLAVFALFALVVDVGLLRTPFTARAVDAIVLPSILFGCGIVLLWRASRTARRAAWLIRIATIAATALVVTSVSAGGQFGSRVGVLAGQWRSTRVARVAWREVYDELTASPPLRYYLDRPAEPSVRLAAYVRACVPASDRVLVLWFAPEIYYQSDRLMAQRHLVFVPPWAALDYEQRMTLEKVRRFSPPLALARRSALDTQARATFPDVVAYVEREYRLAGTIEESGEEYMIFARRDRLPIRGFGPQRWPCYVSDQSIWSRVGHSVD